jgi:hypothetical protein
VNFYEFEMGANKFLSFMSNISAISNTSATIDIQTYNPNTGFNQISFCLIVITQDNAWVELATNTSTNIDMTVRITRLLIPTTKFTWLVFPPTTFSVIPLISCIAGSTTYSTTTLNARAYFTGVNAYDANTLNFNITTTA